MKIIVLALALSLSLLWSQGAALAQTADYSLYDEVLQAYVKGDRVDYAGLKKDRAKLDQFLQELAQVDPDKLSSPEQMAYYINIYNAWTLWLILTKYPDLESIKDLGGLFSSPWSKKIVKVGGKLLTLDNVEHDILRPRFKDPRIHFALNCASKGCPPLLNRPYTGTKLDKQLDQVTIVFINDPERTQLKGNTLRVTKLMDWYAGDFGHDPVGFVKKYARGGFKKKLEKLGKEIEVDFLDYDWSLNAQ
jgi:uncharacterized protein DUF547